MRVRLAGTLSVFPPCQPARSRTISACSPAPSVAEKASRKSPLRSPPAGPRRKRPRRRDALHRRCRPTRTAGPEAPEAGGRVSTSDDRAGPFVPPASRPENTGSPARWDGHSPPHPARRGAPFCEASLGLLVRLRVRRPGLLSRKSLAPQNPRQALRDDALVKARLDPPAEVGQRPAAHAIPLRVRAAENAISQQRELRLRQRRRPARQRTVVKPRKPFGVVTNHRIAQRLALHARGLRRLRPA